MESTTCAPSAPASARPPCTGWRLPPNTKSRQRRSATHFRTDTAHCPRSRSCACIILLCRTSSPSSGWHYMAKNLVGYYSDAPVHRKITTLPSSQTHLVGTECVQYVSIV